MSLSFFLSHRNTMRRRKEKQEEDAAKREIASHLSKQFGKTIVFSSPYEVKALSKTLSAIAANKDYFSSLADKTTVNIGGIEIRYDLDKPKNPKADLQAYLSVTDYRFDIKRPINGTLVFRVHDKSPQA